VCSLISKSIRQACSPFLPLPKIQEEHVRLSVLEVQDSMPSLGVGVVVNARGYKFLPHFIGGLLQLTS